MTDERDAVSTGRRRALKLLGLAGALAVAGGVVVHAQETDIADMKPGSFVWYPDRAPEGFVSIIVSLPDQRCYVYRNGVRIGVSTCSTGKAGHETPVGIFTILQKDADHHSSIYDDASMPFTERLTWSGVALHAGGLPGYPSSHGCVHLPLEFAKLLFAVTHNGTPVIIADSHSQPVDVLHPGLVLPKDATTAISTDPTAEAAETKAAAQDAVSMVISGADKSLTVLKDGAVVLTAPVTIRDPETPLGNVVYVLKSVGGEVSWTSIAYEANKAAAGKATQVIDRITVAPDVNKELASLLVPGSTMLITELSAHAGTRSDPNFVIMAPATS
ncbi:L,D-transpeptidase [Ancylobacter sp. G4_0304]|uniref:L,D-transpeptidase n=1 Tax=Ancylobacter sp. G4_0304 TaxID=3114289 RepID=UPI0039C73790